MNPDPLRHFCAAMSKQARKQACFLRVPYTLCVSCFTQVRGGEWKAQSHEHARQGACSNTSHGLLASPPAAIFSDLTAAPLAQERAAAGRPPQPHFDEPRGREDEMLTI